MISNGSSATGLHGVEGHQQALGYVSGLRQPARPASFQGLLPSAIDLAALDRHLEERFLLTLQPIQTWASSVPASREAIALEFTWRAMQLAGGLLRAIKVPSFDNGVIAGLTADPKDNGRFTACCLLPAIDQIPFHLTTQCMKLAYRLLSKLADTSLSEEAITALFDELDDKFVEPAQRQVQGGNSTVALLEAAYRLDIPFRHLGAGTYQLGWGAKARVIDRSACERDSAFGSSASHNKQTATILLREAGLPVPQHVRARDLAQATEAARTFGFPVVVKPADRDRGEGVTVGVSDEDQLKTAFAMASGVSSRVLVERQVAGVCHRMFVVGDEVLYTVARRPKLVDGDGVHTIRELIAIENAIEARKVKHWRKLTMTVDDDVNACIADQGFDLDAIPPLGQRVFLRRIESSEWGGKPELVNDVHPDNLRIAVSAARMLRLYVAGVDLISPDISRPWHENDAVINEVNYAPLIRSSYDYQRASLGNPPGK